MRTVSTKNLRKKAEKLSNMKVQALQINLGRKILHDQNEHSIEIGLQVDLEPEEDSESVYYSVKSSLEGQLDTWEHEIRTNERPSILTLTEMGGETMPPLVTASDMKPKATRTRKTPQRTQYQPEQVGKQEQEIVGQQESYICPVCGEQMLPKEGKEYFLCGKHWGYPDMIKKGNVRDRKF